MESILAESSQKARARWKFLANVLTKNNNENDVLQNSVSVRRFPGFGFFKATEQRDFSSNDNDFQTFEYTSSTKCFFSPRIFITLRKMNADLQITELTGFDNTGNICIWPSEEVLAYYTLKHKKEFEHLRVCELGAGMTALAGIMLAASCGVSEVYLTDGNEQSVNNINRIISNNQFGDTTVHTSKLIWDENYMPTREMSSHFDIVIASDCLFYKQSHKGLCHTIDALLTPKGKAILMAPHRSGTLQQFCNTASDYFNVQIVTNYDDMVTSKIKEASSLGDMFDEDIHSPVMVELHRKQSNYNINRSIHNLQG